MKKIICDECGEENDYDCTEEEMLKEKEANGWGEMSVSSMAVVCDDCYNKIMASNDHEPGTKKEKFIDCSKWIRALGV